MFGEGAEGAQRLVGGFGFGLFAGGGGGGGGFEVWGEGVEVDGEEEVNVGEIRGGLEFGENTVFRRGIPFH